MNTRFNALRRAAAHLLAALSLACVALPGQAQTPDVGAAFAAAMTAYEQHHWAQSYEALARLADRGHAEAARIASQMHRWGPRLYGTRFAADAEQLARWQRLAWCANAASAAACAVAAAP